MKPSVQLLARGKQQILGIVRDLFTNSGTKNALRDSRSLIKLFQGAGRIASDHKIQHTSCFLALINSGELIRK